MGTYIVVSTSLQGLVQHLPDSAIKPMTQRSGKDNPSISVTLVVLVRIISARTLVISMFIVESMIIGVMEVVIVIVRTLTAIINAT
jgi:hypothetical protein